MNAVHALIACALEKGLVEPCEEIWARNAVLEYLRADAVPPVEVPEGASLAEILDALTEDAIARGVLTETGIVYRDLFDTGLMGRLTPRPAQVIAEFQKRLAQSPRLATDWYYEFSRSTNYIRTDRIARDVQWKAPTEYGELDITINLSKPEKDPRAIASFFDIKPENCMMVGDDFFDLPAFAICGISVAVADAAPEVRDLADWVTVAKGGRGALREAVERLLKARDEWKDFIKPYYDLFKK